MVDLIEFESPLQLVTSLPECNPSVGIIITEFFVNDGSPCLFEHKNIQVKFITPFYSYFREGLENHIGLYLFPFALAHLVVIEVWLIVVVKSSITISTFMAWSFI